MRIQKFSGLDNQNNPLDVGLSGFVVAKNVDVDRKGRVSTRDGYAQVMSGSVAAMWSDLVLMQSGELLRINETGQIESVAQNIPGNRLTGAKIAGNSYFSTGEYNGVITGNTVRSMGVPVPDVTAVYGVGNLLGGRYLITATAVADDGRESGAEPAIVIDVSDNSSITINVDVPAEYSANIYMSGRDGEEMYFIGNHTQITINEPAQLLNANDPIDRQYKAPMPIGHIFCEHRGHLLVADGEYLYYSDPLDYELCDYANNIIPFDSAITMLVSVESGVFVSAGSEVFFASGETPETWVFRSVYKHPALQGSSIRVDMTKIGEGGSGYGVIFVDKTGSICLGTQDGGVRDMTYKRFKINNNLLLTSVATDSKYLVATAQ